MSATTAAPPLRFTRTARFGAVAALILGLLAAVLLPGTAARADVDDFSYSSWESSYRVSLDEQGYAVARVTETLVAEFPNFDQNKGIIRGYPQRFEGAGLDIRIVSVKDAEGRDVPYETETEDGMLLVLTGDNSYVHGRQTYVIESTMRDFMISATRSGNDEFYWNLLPLNSTQSIGAFRASVSFAPPLAEAFTGDAQCYQGFAGEKKSCTIQASAAGGATRTFAVQSGERAAGDGMTVALGFAPGTVAQPAARQANPVADFAPASIAGGAAVMAGAAWAAFALFRRRHRKATGIVVAQFDVPTDMPPLAAAVLVPGAPNPIPAEFVHLAVQGAVRLEEESGAKARPSVRLVDRARAGDPLDSETLHALFPGAETTRSIPKSSKKFAARMQKLVRRGVTAATERGWTMQQRSGLMAACGAIALVLLAASIVAVIWAGVQDRDSLGPSILAVCAAFALVLITSLFAFKKHTVLSPAGAERHEYLLGVKEFIRVAEADRLRMLQSYQGAERRRDGSVDVVHLYEKLLPYAMLLGQEKSWTRVLETTYSTENAEPSWMNVAIGVSIGSRLGQYSSSVNAAATYSPASSGGGSTGGGFSGGGGGGGFSGGR